MVNKEKAKEVANEEVFKRIVTLEDAKQDFKKWISETRKHGGFDKHILEFWDEVVKQVDDIKE